MKGVMYLSSNGVITIVTIRLPVSQPTNISCLHEIPPAVNVIAPQPAPARLFNTSPKTRNIKKSLLVLRPTSAPNVLKAINGIKTCQRSANDQNALTSGGMPAVIPAPMKHPMYAAIAPQIPNHRVNAIIKATAKYNPATPGAICQLIMAKRDKSEFIIVIIIKNVK